MIEQAPYLLIPFAEFEQKVKILIAKGNVLMTHRINSEDDFKTFEVEEKNWVGEIGEVIGSSFANNASFISSFRAAGRNQYHISGLIGKQKSIQDLWQEIVNIIKGKNYFLQHFLKILSVSDYIINREGFKAPVNYTTTQKTNLVLYKLYKLNDGNLYSVQGILEGNGVVLRNLNEIRGIGEVLESHGYIRTLGGAGHDIQAEIETKGCLYVESNPKQFASFENNTYNLPKQSDAINSDQVFIVHGHNEAMKHAVARLVSKINLKPVILHEQANLGKTIIEKFSTYSDVGYAIVLLSADDIGYSRKETSRKKRLRARQNVIFELGYFIGKLGRDRVIALFEPDKDFEVPTDYSGVLLLPFDEKNAWETLVAKELKASGAVIDMNLL